MVPGIMAGGKKTEKAARHHRGNPQILQEVERCTEEIATAKQDARPPGMVVNVHCLPRQSDGRVRPKKKARRMAAADEGSRPGAAVELCRNRLIPAAGRLAGTSLPEGAGVEAAAQIEEQGLLASCYGKGARAGAAHNRLLVAQPMAETTTGRHAPFLQPVWLVRQASRGLVCRLAKPLSRKRVRRSLKS